MRSLVFKLTLAFLLVSLTGIPLVALLAGLITAREFQSYTEARVSEIALHWVADYYDTNGSWDGLEKAFGRARLLRRPGSDQQGAGQSERGQAGQGQPRQGQSGQRQQVPPNLRPLVVDLDGRAVVRALGYEQGDQIPSEIVRRGVPIEVNDQIVGKLLFAHTFGYPPVA